jgi:hypothetical protein
MISKEQARESRIGRFAAVLPTSVALGWVTDITVDAPDRLSAHLIRGRSVKRIARETGRSEPTVRQRGVAIYRKSGLSGRAELAGFFLRGLLLPRGSREAPPGR